MLPRSEGGGQGLRSQAVVPGGAPMSSRSAPLAPQDGQRARAARPKPYSGWNGTPSSRTTITSSRACNSSATSNATRTPPRGRPSTATASVPLTWDQGQMAFLHRASVICETLHREGLSPDLASLGGPVLASLLTGGFLPFPARPTDRAASPTRLAWFHQLRCAWRMGRNDGGPWTLAGELPGEQCWRIMCGVSAVRAAGADRAAVSAGRKR